ncbi:unnamed protein product [Dibothriocephalus latus]|uniref:GCF C-terminal domain-containing protein n=1 Tax=Dibothriocephalus latus TaxID=60516 RepID=A0A3P7R1E4_DIBLA|nr:unnamed protein product [Dibothriocephalus latus]
MLHSSTSFKLVSDDILNDAQRLFDDTVEEYWTISSILKRFDEWRGKSPTTYAKAYIALCLPQLLSPLIRLQLLGWNPIKVGLPLDVRFYVLKVSSFCGSLETMPPTRLTYPSWLVCGFE